MDEGAVNMELKFEGGGRVFGEHRSECGVFTHVCGVGCGGVKGTVVCEEVNDIRWQCGKECELLSEWANRLRLLAVRSICTNLWKRGWWE